MAQTKATKKFEKNHLKDTIKRRKEAAKIKQKKQVKEKRKARRAKEDGQAAEDDEEVEGGKAPSGKANGNTFADMSVDEFFQGGFDIPELPGKKKKGKVTGKRKRAEVDEQEDDAGSSSDEAQENGAIEEDDDDESEDDMEDHKQQLEALAKNDPEFYKHLQENDPELLEFTDDNELAGLQLSESEEDEPKAKKQKTGKKGRADDEDSFGEESSNEVTKEMVEKWHTGMKEHNSLRGMREIIMAFRAAVRSNEDDGKEYKYSVSNPDVYHELLVTAMADIPTVVAHHLPTKETASGKVRVPTSSKKYSTLTPILKTHANSLQYLLSTLSDAATLKLTLSSILPLLPYLLSLKKLIRELCRTIATIWSSPAHNDATRIAAFLVLRRLTVLSDPGIRENILKISYQSLIQGSRATTTHTLAGVNLMKNSAVELWGLVDSSQAYTMAFNFIRQLAIHLRTSIISKEKESYKTIYNWQFMHSLDFWSRALSTHCNTLLEAETGKQSSLRPLIYPLVQITLGAMRLVPSPAYFPLRFQLIRSLIRVAKSTDTYIPLAPALLEVLSSPECKKAPKPASLRPVEWDTSIRISKTYLRTRVWQDGLGEQAVELLGEWAGMWAKSVAFPELMLPVTVMLKRWLKDVSGNKYKQHAGFKGKGKAKDTGGNKNSKMNSAVALLVQKFESNARWIEERRAKIDFAPNDRAGVEGFLKEELWEKSPLGAYLAGQRKVREDRAKVVEQGRQADERKRKEERGGEAVSRRAAPTDAFEAEDQEEDDDEGPDENEDDDAMNVSDEDEVIEVSEAEDD
ncbi:Noc2-domain-containing protein [Rhizodiscina lignyota]|uniref:Noc2-domain-containing protein n=1 Tax=Rhizodiscina lignyota TaxID=1504668 RepID=A0A9P4IG16_9PEZI|nr:Noc2-domain-containing protein [Rhizodiscina lignyota]